MHILVPLLPRLVVVHLVLLRSPAVPHTQARSLLPRRGYRAYSNPVGDASSLFMFIQLFPEVLIAPRRTEISRLHLWILKNE